MNITPSPEKIKEYSTGGKYNIFPVSCEILSDFITPIEALRVLKNVSEHVYLLESAKSDDRWGRYTFLGYNPKTCISDDLPGDVIGLIGLDTTLRKFSS